MYKFFKNHVGHNIEIVTYGNENISVECNDCNEVLLSYDKDENNED